MYFPMEVMDAIIASLVEFTFMANHIEKRKAPSWDVLLSRCDEPVIVRDRHGAAKRTKSAVLRLDTQTLLVLRLVSRQWCASATVMLAKHHCWVADFDHKKKPETAFKAFGPNPYHQREDKGHAHITPVGQLVRKLVIPQICSLRTFSRDYAAQMDDYDEEFRRETNIGGESCTYVSYLTKCFNPRGSARWVDDSMNLAKHYEKEHEHTIIRRLVDSTQRIESFSASFMGASNDEDEGDRAECYEKKGLLKMLHTLQYGLKADAFASLKSLDLEIPTTHDVAVLSKALGLDAREKLRHLRLAIVDQTGPSGSHSYRQEEHNWDGDLDQASVIESGYYPSNWQIKYPNRQHQDKMFEFVSSCRNLESLEIKATQFLNLDMLASKWSPNLKVLSLTRLWACTSSLLKLLSPPPGNGQTSAILRVSLHDIKIRADGGKWSAVFQHLRKKCPDLEFCHLYQLAYLDGHPHYESNGRPWENTNELWTADRTDDWEYDELGRSLIAKAGGAEYYPGEWQWLVDEDD